MGRSNSAAGRELPEEHSTLHTLLSANLMIAHPARPDMHMRETLRLDR